ncbi:MAG: hypothetical protein M1820_006749 [Bogoriella megaspora]|nr:MAG: hypothetical protein M1820_006749 [Bogoriella megaspora]
MTGKRKREEGDLGGLLNGQNKKQLISNGLQPHTTIQIIVGSYEKVLRGFTATIPQELLEHQSQTPPNGHQDDSDSLPESHQISFADTFLLSPHRSSLTCLALSPPSSSSPKLTLATGSTDSTINLYSLSTTPPPRSNLPSVTNTLITPHPSNRPLGTLTHHTHPLTALTFPTSSKLLSTSLDNTLSITRTRDWTLLSSIRAPIPKPRGRPSGDTLTPGDAPCGVNDAAVHPSNKLVVSVGRGERCMRLWNLVTGKKAGVLSFGREVLERVGEGKERGEGANVVWDRKGEEFAVGFERGVGVWEVDARVRCVVRLGRGKVGRVSYVNVGGTEGRAEEEEDEVVDGEVDKVGDGEGERRGRKVLAISTEDGRVLFFDTRVETESGNGTAKNNGDIPEARFIGQLGGTVAGISGRIKDFKVLEPPANNTATEQHILLLVTGSSDGAIRIWRVDPSELQLPPDNQAATTAPATGTNGTNGTKINGDAKVANQIGNLLGTFETGNRITCLEAFVMSGVAGPIIGAAEGDGMDASESSESDSESDD